ncbi:ATP-binding cassette domain-containing protein [Halobacillus litoralis]|uniref:ATP-binding cassette domain-containing protein n=1 Tax=Halobacillus litoralis TaxID=45668 RepID=A0A845DVQ8_9BACI|nr:MULTISPECIES: ATP-binding cassette domain-containing protein [Halobacillus]MYL21580.1 ATP-binding cassette domain-containing protein [Halobacillus litoralis]MYL29966.1 ATP-binding cassette domain-containing protein [Halobacillus halophilus]
MVEVKHVSKTYGSKKVIENLSVDIHPGKITSFIGSNGAGKSTLLSMLSRLISKDEGRVLLHGRDIHSIKPNDLAKELSILKQSNHIDLRIQVRDLISFGRFPYSQGRLTKEDWVEINKAIHYMELEEIQERYIDELSGGQLQRAYIAMIIAQDTDYVMLDEPLNNLDMKHSVQIMKSLRKMVEEMGKTVVIVIHDINFASCYSDRIVALKEGEIVREGPTEEMINSDMLKEVYDMDIPVQLINGERICLHFK